MFGGTSARLRKHLEANGKRATATVVKIATRGTSVSSGGGTLVSDTKMALRTTLMVHPEGEPEFEVRKTFQYPQLAIPREGTQIAVIYDPADHKKLMIDDSPDAQQGAALSAAGLDPATLAAMLQAQPGGGETTIISSGPGAQPPAPPGANRVEQLEKLVSLKEKGVLSEAEFEAEKARILEGS